LLAIVVTGMAAPVIAQQATYKAPRTDSGRPDLQGVWNFSSGVPLERPSAVGDRKLFTKEEFERQRAAIRKGLATIALVAPVEAVGLDSFDDTLYVEDLRTSLITYPANGRLPAIVEGVPRMPRFEDLIGVLSGSKEVPPQLLATFVAMFAGSRKDSYADFNQFERCLLAADVPLLPQIVENYVQIVQGSDAVALVTEFDRRVVIMNGRPPASGAPRSWTGTSRGHWEGETLVVDTTGFNDRTPSFAGVGKAHDKVVTERFTRTSSTMLQYSATVVDPKTFRDRIELSSPMAKVDAHLYEGGCHEGNRSLANALSAARKQDEARLK
jgi:hypothetical protein